MAKWPLLCLAFAGLVLTSLLPALKGESQAAQTESADPWPREMHMPTGIMTIYQPQVDSWDGGFLKLRAAISVRPAAGEEVFGIVRASAHTLVDRSTRMVTLFNFSLLQIDFPSLADHGEKFHQDVATFLPDGITSISLDRLQGYLSIEKLTPRTVATKDDPPLVIVSYKPAVLVPIHGSPALRRLPNSSLERVVNTRALIIKVSAGAIFLHVYDGWMSAPSLNGPWHAASGVSPSLDQIAAELSKSGEVDLLAGDPKEKLSLSVSVPGIYVAYEPAKLIVFKGQPWFQPIQGTQLLWVTNSSGDVIMDAADNRYYVLMSGRWFRAGSLAGPWTHVPGHELPPDFHRIPINSPAAEVLAGVPGTPQAREAMIADSIPQTALVPREGGPRFQPVLDGAPQLRIIEGTSLQYVWNSPDAVIRVDATSYYALRDGVWYFANSLEGPWAVATLVPDVIYSIPSSSPLHYVTYVDIYWASPESVEVGYTPGYMGTVIDPDGVVVYGTGYNYPAWIGTSYYPPPPTYGYAAYPAYDAAGDAMLGFALGLTTAALLAPEPSWGPMYYNNYYSSNGCCWAAGSENIYGRYGSTTYSGYRNYGYNPYTGNAGTTGAYHTYTAATGVSSNIQSYHGYNAYTGEQGAGYSRQLYNQNTGASGNVTRNASYNPETGEFERNGSGSAYNPNTGASASVQHNSEANAYGGSFGSTTATVTNRGGQTNTYSAGHAGNDIYAGSDGQVYRSSGNGWLQNTSSGWRSMGGSFNSSELNRTAQSRGWGSRQFASFSQRGSSGGGGGFRHFGGRR